MSKIRAIAERLRSENKHERMSAVSIIERQTGNKIDAIIQNGTYRGVIGAARNNILAHLTTKTGDAIIVAISREIATLKLSWGDIIEAGIPKKAPASGDKLESRLMESWNAIFSEVSVHEMWNQAYQEMQAANARKPSKTPKEPTSFTRVGREDLPDIASGIPYVSNKATARTGAVYVIVSFRRMIADGKQIAPMVKFIAFGDEFVAKILLAEKEARAISVRFKDNGASKHVTLIEAD